MEKWNIGKYFARLFRPSKTASTIQCGFCDKKSKLPRGTQFGGFICYNCSCGHVMLTKDQGLRLLRDFVLELEPLIETHNDGDLPFEKRTVVESFFTSTFQLLLNGIPALKASFHLQQKKSFKNRKSKKQGKQMSKQSRGSKIEKRKKEKYHSGAGFLVMCHHVNQMFTCLKPFLQQMDDNWAAAVSALDATINLLPGPTYDLCRRVHTAEKTILCLVRTDSEEEDLGEGSFQRTFSFSVNDRQDFSKSDDESFMIDIPRTQSDLPRTSSGSIRPLPRHGKRRRGRMGMAPRPLPNGDGSVSDTELLVSIPDRKRKERLSRAPHKPSISSSTSGSSSSSSTSSSISSKSSSSNTVRVSSSWMRDDLLDSKFFEGERKRDRTRAIEQERLKHSLPVHVNIKTFRMQKSQQQQNLPPISISLRASPSVSILTTTTHSTSTSSLSLSSQHPKPGVLATKIPLDPSFEIDHTPSSPKSSSTTTSTFQQQKSIYSYIPPPPASSTSYLPTFPLVAKQQLIKTRTLPSSHYAQFPFRPLSPSPAHYPSTVTDQTLPRTNSYSSVSNVGTPVVIHSSSSIVVKGQSPWKDMEVVEVGVGVPSIGGGGLPPPKKPTSSSISSIYAGEEDEKSLSAQRRPLDRRLRESAAGPPSVFGMGQQEGGANPFLMADKDNEDERKRMVDESIMIVKMIREQKERREREERERLEKERRAREYAEAMRLQEERQRIREEKARQVEEEKKKQKVEQQIQRKKRQEMVVKNLKALEANLSEKLLSWAESERQARENNTQGNWLSSSEFSGFNF